MEESDQPVKKKKKNVFTRMTKVIKASHLFSRKKNAEIDNDPKKVEKSPSIQSIPGSSMEKNTLEIESKRSSIKEASSNNSLSIKESKDKSQRKSNYLSMISNRISSHSSQLSDENRKPKKMHSWLNKTFASSSDFLTPPDPNSSITARVTHSQVFLPWSYLFKSILFGVNFLLLSIVFLILIFSWGYENVIQNELCHIIFHWNKANCLEFPYFILFAYTYTIPNIIYITFIIFWHPIRKIWINWRPKPSKFSQVYSKKSNNSRREYVQSNSSMSIIHPIYNIFIFSVSIILIAFAFSVCEPWLMNLWIASFCTLIPCIVILLSILLCLFLIVFLVIWTKKWISIKNKNNTEIEDPKDNLDSLSDDGNSTSKLKKFFRSKKRNSIGELKDSESVNSKTDSIKRPSGLSIYIIRMISLWSIMVSVCVIIISICVLLACYVPTSFVYYPSIDHPDHPINPPPKIFATGGLTVSNSGYMIAPHTLSAFYTALSDQNVTGGIATNVYFTSDGVAIVMGSETENSLYSMTDIKTIFPNTDALSWKDLTFEQLEQLQVIKTDDSNSEEYENNTQIPRIASLSDLLNLLKDFSEKMLYLTVNNQVSKQLDDILTLIHSTSSQDQVVLVLQQDMNIDPESFQSALMIPYITSKNLESNELIFKGPSKAIHGQENTTFKYSFNHIAPRWDILCRVWCQNAYGIFTNEPILTETQLTRFSKAFNSENSLFGMMTYDTWVYYRTISLGIYCVFIILHIIAFFILYIIYHRNIEKWKRRRTLEV